MATDYNRGREARARGYEASSAVYIIGAAVITVLIAMLLFFTLGDRSPTGSTVTTAPTPNPTAPATQPQAPPANTTTPGTPAPSPTPSTR
jgi:hypothetical protein